MTGMFRSSQTPQPNGFSATNVFNIQAGLEARRRPRHWGHDVEVRLQELVRLSPGWDGYQGQPVSFGTAVFALRVLESTCKSATPTPQIVPGTSGDLQLEWHLASGDIELHVHAPNDVTAWRLVPGVVPFEEEVQLSTDFSTVVNWIADLTEVPLAPRAAAV